jgi:hypothetical protein
MTFSGEVAFHQSGNSSKQFFIEVAIHRNCFSLKWQFIETAFHCSDNSSKQLFIEAAIHQNSFSLKRQFIKTAFH